MMDISRVMAQTEREMFFQFGGCAVMVTNLSSFKNSILRIHIIYAFRVNVVKYQEKVIRTMICILLHGMY